MAKKYTREDFPLEQTFSIKESLFRYFYSAQKAMHHYDEYAQRYKRIDFKLMHRFLHTTFKTLREIDPEFRAHKLQKLYKTLIEMSKIYDDFLAKSRTGIGAYETIFLQQQKGFVALEEKLIANSEEINYLRGQTRRFKESIKELIQEMSAISRSTALYKEKDEELKRQKRHENNAIVRLGDLVDQNSVLHEVITEFRDKYEEPFLRSFSRYVHEKKPHLKKILDAMAYAFDIELWFKAKESPIIRNYFKNAYTGEIVSSRTYLEYYLKNLDATKLNKENQQLQQLFFKLKQEVGKEVCIIMSQEYALENFAKALEADAAKHTLHKYTSTFALSLELFERPIDVFYIDMTLPEDTLKEFITQAKNNPQMFDTTSSKIVAVAETVDDEAIELANFLNASTLIEQDVEPVEILDALYAALDDESA